MPHYNCGNSDTKAFPARRCGGRDDGGVAFRQMAWAFVVSIYLRLVVHFVAPVTRAIEPQETDKVLSNEDKKLSKQDKVMSDVFYAQNLLRDAFPQRRYGKVESVFYEAHRFINRRVNKQITIRRIRTIWEGKARRIDSEEMEALKAALYEESRREQVELRARLASLDEKIAAFETVQDRPSLAGNGR